MRKNRVYRLLGMILTLVLLTTTLLTPVYAEDVEMVGSADELFVDEVTDAESINPDELSE